MLLLYASLRCGTIISTTGWCWSLNVCSLIQLCKHHIQLLSSLLIARRAWPFINTPLTPTIILISNATSSSRLLRGTINRAFVKNLDIIVIVIVNVNRWDFLSLNVYWSSNFRSTRHLHHHLSLISDYLSFVGFLLNCYFLCSSWCLYVFNLIRIHDVEILRHHLALFLLRIVYFFRIENVLLANVFFITLSLITLSLLSSLNFTH